MTYGIHDLMAFLPGRHHRPDQLGGILQISIHDDAGIGLTFVQAREDGRFLAEVTTQADDGTSLQQAWLMQELLEASNGVVITAVIDDDQAEANPSRIRKKAFIA